MNYLNGLQTNFNCNSCSPENLSPCPFISGSLSFDSAWNVVYPVSGKYEIGEPFYKNYGPCSWKVTISNAHHPYPGAITPLIHNCDEMFRDLEGVYYLDNSKIDENTFETKGNTYCRLRIVGNSTGFVATLYLHIFSCSTPTIYSWSKQINTFDGRNLSFSMTDAADNGVGDPIGDILVEGLYSDTNLYEQNTNGDNAGVISTNITNNFDFYDYFFNDRLAELSWMMCGVNGYKKKDNGNQFTNQQIYLSGTITDIFSTYVTDIWEYPCGVEYQDVFLTSLTISSGISNATETIAVNNCRRCSELSSTWLYKSEYGVDDATNKHRVYKDIMCDCNDDIRHIILNLAHPTSTITVSGYGLYENAMTYTASTPTGIAPPTSLSFSHASTYNNYPCVGGGTINIGLEYDTKVYGYKHKRVNNIVAGGNAGYFPDVSCPDIVEAYVTIGDWVPLLPAYFPTNKPPTGTFALPGLRSGPFPYGFTIYDGTYDDGYRPNAIFRIYYMNNTGELILVVVQMGSIFCFYFLDYTSTPSDVICDNRIVSGPLSTCYQLYSDRPIGTGFGLTSTIIYAENWNITGASISWQI